MKKLHFLVSMLSLFLASCTITQRHYRPGFYTDYSKYKVTSLVLKDSFPRIVSDKSIPVIKHVIYTTHDTTVCDEIILLNGQVKLSKVTQISADEIYYKVCDSLAGPQFNINKSKVFMIRYGNGKTLVINNQLSKDSLGYNAKGYQLSKYDSLGFDAQGYNSQGYDKDGYDKTGFNANGLDRAGKTKSEETQASTNNSPKSLSAGHVVLIVIGVILAIVGIAMLFGPYLGWGIVLIALALGFILA